MGTKPWRLCGICVWVALISTVAQGRHPNEAPRRTPEPDTQETIVVASVQELYRAVPQLKSGATLLLRKGEYRLDKPIHIRGERRSDITIRGETDRFEDVVIRGAGMNNRAVHHGVLAENVDGLVVANVTIGWVGYHPIALSPNCRRVQIYHCRLVDAGEQFIKASSDRRGGGVDEGTVEYCVLEYTRSGPPNGYTNGVDVHGGDDWVIRHNLFRNIRTEPGAEYKAVPAVLMWNGAKNTVCEGNTFIDCDRAIAFGLVEREEHLDHEGGMIRNNFIVADKRRVPHLDAGIFVASPGTKVLHNTILLNGGYPNAIEVRWKRSVAVEVVNNLSDSRITSRDGAQILERGNSTDAQPGWFQGAAKGDLRPGRQLERVVAHELCPDDWTGAARAEERVFPGAADGISR